MVDLSGARAAITTAFQLRTLRTTTRTPNVSSVAGLSPKSGATAEGAAVIETGSYALTLPALTTLELAPSEEITIDEIPGRLFRVVWAPPAGNLNLSRRYGVEEVR